MAWEVGARGVVRGKQTLERWSAEEFTARVLTPSEPPGEGSTEVGPPLTTLVLFDEGTSEDLRLAGVLASAAADHADRVRAAVVRASDLRSHLESWEAHRSAVHTCDFSQRPVVGVFRRGRLLTTFRPRPVFFAESLQRREDREQLEIFLEKLVYFDPAKVKEQKTIEVEAGA